MTIHAPAPESPRTRARSALPRAAESVGATAEAAEAVPVSPTRAVRAGSRAAGSVRLHEEPWVITTRAAASPRTRGAASREVIASEVGRDSSDRVGGAVEDECVAFRRGESNCEPELARQPFGHQLLPAGLEDVHALDARRRVEAPAAERHVVDESRDVPARELLRRRRVGGVEQANPGLAHGDGNPGALDREPSPASPDFDRPEPLE